MENKLGELEYKKALERAADEKKPTVVKHAHFYKAGAFNASNLSCLFFTAAVRTGYDPDIIWNEMRDMIIHRGIPNGFLKENPHGAAFFLYGQEKNIQMLLSGIFAHGVALR